MGRPAHEFRSAWRVFSWNLLIVIACLMAIAGVGEAWLRLTAPFVHSSFPQRFASQAGLLGQPNAEVRWTNGADFWTVSETNSLGFLDREPIDPERAAASCHIAVLGDSMVEAKEVPIASKFHVLLEAMSAKALPHLDITTAAFAAGGTGQINQLPFYDEYAKRLRPKLLLLVWGPTDFVDNSPILKALSSYEGLDPERMPYMTARRDANGELGLVPPDPTFATGRFDALSWTALAHWLRELFSKTAGASYFTSWIYQKSKPLFFAQFDAALATRAESLSQAPRHAALREGWTPTTRSHIPQVFGQKRLPPVFEEALNFSAFALDQFKARAARDGFALAILSTHSMGTQGDPIFDRMAAMAAARGIPVISQLDHIIRHGAKAKEAQWERDEHWSVAGHRWAAGALLDYLKENPTACRSDDPAAP